MSKGSSNDKSKKSHTSKPYDVSQSFVAKVASRVTELLPQRTWLNRWLSPDVGYSHHVASSLTHQNTSTPMVNSHHTNLSPDPHGPGPSKRPRLPINSPPQFQHNKFLQSTPLHEEELSPIGPPIVLSNDSAVAGPSGLCQFSQKTNFTPTSTAVAGEETPQLKLEDKLAAATRQSSATDKLNGGDDCSETSESTSGCSSLVPQAQTLQSRRSESRHLNFPGNRSGASGLDRSLFPGRSSPKVDLTSLKRRRPSFDTTTFTSSSRLMNISANPNQTLSPFYSGRTTYGGASAYNSSMSSSTGLFSQTPRRLGVTVRPVNVNTPTEPVLSTTAKKILDALEQFSTPVVDAKRLPIMTGSKRKLERYAELNLPVTTTELLRVKRKERLQRSTSAARQASLSSSHQDAKSMSSSEQAEYRIRSNDGDDEKHTNKITRKMKDVDDDQLEQVNLPSAVLPLKTLPKIDIPIPPCPKAANTTAVCSSGKDSCATSQPFFVAHKPPPNAAMSVSSSGISSFTSSSSLSDQEFKMSAPLPVQADTNSRTSLNTENFNFIFSEPIRQDSKKESSEFSFLSSNKSRDGNSSFSFLNAMSDNKNKSLSNIVNLGSKKSNVGSNDSKIITSPIVSTKSTDGGITTVTTSSMTGGSSKTNKPKSDSNWKCNTCSVTNSEDNNVCTACDNKKSFAPVTSSSPLVFKPPADTWECKECFIRNKNSVNVCAACASPKTVKKTSVSSSSLTSSTARSTTIDTVTKTTSSVSTSSSSVTSTTVTTGFGDKFKPPSDTWECKECFVRNKNAADKCVSCGTVKSGAASVEKKSTGSTGFGSSFKKPEGSWECSSCMVQNDSKSLKCVACETCKPGAEKEASAAASSSITTSGFTFGMPASSSSGAGFSLSGSAGTGLGNKEESKTISGFQFGGSSSSTNVSANFTFGIPASKPKVNDATPSPKDKKIKPLSNDKLSNPLQELAKLQEKQSGNAQTAFKFGVNHDKSNEKQESNSEKSVVTNRNLFGSTESMKSNDTSSKSNVNVFKSKIETTSNSFIFGSNTSSEKTDSSANKTSNFMFQPKTDQPAASGAGMLFGNANKTTQPETKPTTQSDLFTFGSNASNKMGFSTATTKSSTNPMFVFGSSGSSSNENKSNTAFGTSNNNSIQKAVTETKPVFGASNEVPPIFGSAKPEVKPPAFGSSLVNDSKSALSNSLTNSTNVITFAAPTSSITSTGGALQSGFKQETPVNDSSFLAFGSNTTAPSPFQTTQQTQQQSEKSLFAVNSVTPGLQTIATTQSTGFAFGSSSGTCNNDQAKPFGFGSSQAPSSTFSFGASSTIPAQNFNFTPKEAEPSVGFNFTPATPVQSNQVPAPVFGVQNPTPSFGSTSTPNNLFTFGSQSAQPQTQPASSAPVFGFNSSQSTPTPNAFVFGSSNTDNNQTPVTSTPAVPAFNPNAKPTFNFTGGSTPSFTATPIPLVGTPATTQVVRRPIKKAVRRSGQLR